MHSKDLIFTVLGDTVLLIGGVCAFLAFSQTAQAQSSRESDGRPKDRVAPAVYSSVSVSREIRSEYSPTRSAVRDRTVGRAARAKEVHSEATDIRITITGTKGSDARAAQYYQSGVRCVSRQAKVYAWDQNSVSEATGSESSIISSRSCRSWPASEPWKWRSLSEIRSLAGNVPRHSQMRR